MKSTLTVSGTLARPIRCEGCPHRGRAWCLDEDEFDEDENKEDEE